jgi:mannose-6-phosphate isomerase-like protein (cupin superfamily)
MLMMETLLLALLLGAQQPAGGAQPPPAGTAQPRRASTTTIDVRVTDRSGSPAAGAQVTAEGPSARNGVTDADGAVVFGTMTAGVYRFRAEGDGFVTLEKEITIKGAKMTAEFALSAAPAPPPPPPPPAPAPAPAPVVEKQVLPAGEPRVLSIPEMAERSLGGRDPIRMLPIGCSGASSAQLVIVRETLSSDAQPEVDEILYLVAGEASLTMSEKKQPLTPGWFVLVPRGMSRTVTRNGRNPAILLSISSGEPCGAESGNLRPAAR